MFGDVNHSVDDKLILSAYEIFEKGLSKYIHTFQAFACVLSICTQLA